MLVFFVFGFIASIATAVSIGVTISSLNDAMGYMGGKISNPAFGVFITGFIITFSVTAFWAFMLEHAKNVEKTIDTMYRESKGLPLLPDSEYSALPSFMIGLTQPRPALPAQQTMPAQYSQPGQPQYAPQQYAQPVPAAQPVQPVQPVQPIQPATLAQPMEAAQPVPQAIPAQPMPVPAAQPIQEVQPVPQPIPQPVAPAPSADWTRECGNTNIANAKFCSACGSPRK